ncbi:alpha-galactosidase [Tannockella kyphosi]|uniref:alpha-galactosidase n=1 Tax=Tannockella kyphosi TaxID=2899121 RepID=UPI0020121ACC|nr:alpha-galactosidase [Tannockella kyphosi]
MKKTIITKDNLFVLHTKTTTYAFHVIESGHIEHLYYGTTLPITNSYEAIKPKYEFREGNLITYDSLYSFVGLENRNLEISTRGKGDIREPMVEITYSNGCSTCDFLYDSYKIHKKQALLTLPCSYDENEEVETLVILLKDKQYDLELELHYSVFYDSDVIVKSTKLRNCSKNEVKVDRLLSAQLDFDKGPYVFHTFKGAWIREMNHQQTICQQGIVVNDSKCGTSSSRSNPFVMISTPQTSEDYGDCFGCNLIYSGNHYEAMEVNAFCNNHFLCGVNPFGFQYNLDPGSTLEAPEAVLTYSNNGYGGMSQHMHQFVKEHIVRGVWKNKERPVLLNSWEASYFDFNEKSLLELAKAGKDVGVELFVLDDGWFGKRNNDRSSLGDWYVNKKKLPNGLEGLAKKVNQLGMDFGIWVEPEMVSYDSDCYRNHPEFAVEIPGQRHSLGRHQLLLDLTNEKVQDYLIDQMTQVFSSANISYVKWDMNRIVSDAFSQCLGSQYQGEFYHRYMLGLYRVLEVLTTSFPTILFESCASGGNRFDLGMMCYMPQVWASDNTDAICRSEIQTGCSYGYPMSVIGAHVSACPNHQTLRNTSLETRFQVACFGLLGYECNLVDMNKEELGKIKEQIIWYKKYRKVLQFGNYYRLKNEEGIYQWITVSKDRTIAIGCYLQTLVKANFVSGYFKAKGLCNNGQYHFTNRMITFDEKELGNLVDQVKKDEMNRFCCEQEDYTINGLVLSTIGVRLKQGFGGSHYNENIRIFQDFASRIYIMEEIKRV